MNRKIYRAAVPLLLAFLISGCGEKIDPENPGPPLAAIAASEQVTALSLTSDERRMMRPSLEYQKQNYLALREMDLGNEERPALRFDPEINNSTVAEGVGGPVWSTVAELRRPDNLNDLAFYSVGELSHLIRTRQVSCVELTQLSLDRLEQFGPRLECVITLTRDRALAQARELDAMLQRGQYLGPLHGIPFGAKDLLAVKDYPTTWGATPYKEQRLEETATVVQKLDAAGAVLVAKLTLGALAMDDVWFGGQTRNPWNLEEGSSGSSAGSASAVAAGLVPFAIGTETLGSIVSPSTRCGVTGLRPSFGLVSRKGAMALSWSMDKIGPIARSVEDCALVFDAIRGRDPGDPTTVDKPFNYDSSRDLSGLRIGYLKGVFGEDHQGMELDNRALDDLRQAGARLVPMDFPLDEFGVPNPWDLIIILTAEAGAAFQELTLNNQDDLLVRQRPNDWPDIFRSAQFIPAVEYIQANRARVRLQAMMSQLFESVDVYLTPSLAGPSLMITNLTGHPQVVLPAGFLEENKPHSISFVGDLYDEATVMTVAKIYQDATGWHKKHPRGFEE
jgi:Asp-tRNA(Asn)/Glu-tRNA(Gln) amidotransferase A subunit family amidase